VSRVLLDACVLVPTLTRRMILAAAGQSAFQPLWSERILREWRMAAAKSGPVAAMAVDGEIALLNAQYPRALVPLPNDLAIPELPDPDDRHVLGAAIAGEADELLTFNTRDFPLRVLSQAGILRRHPDEFLLECHEGCREILKQVGEKAAHDFGSQPRKLLRKTQLPRLGKALFERT